MKVKIKSFIGDLPSYLTVEKGYEIEHIDSNGGRFIISDLDGDDDDYIVVSMSDCKHLNGGSWEVVNE